MKIQNFINWFIPEKIKSDVDKNRRCRQMLTFIMVSPLFFIPNAIKWYMMGVNELSLSMFVIMWIVLAAPFALKFTSSIGVLGNVIFVPLALHFTLLPYLTGGIFSSALMWNITIPLFAGVFVGTRSLMFWTGVMLVQLFIFFKLQTTGYAFPALSLTPGQILETQMANIIGPMMAMAITTYFSERASTRRLIFSKTLFPRNRKP